MVANIFEWSSDEVDIANRELAVRDKLYHEMLGCMALAAHLGVSDKTDAVLVATRLLQIEATHRVASNTGGHCPSCCPIR